MKLKNMLRTFQAQNVKAQEHPHRCQPSGNENWGGGGGGEGCTAPPCFGADIASAA